MSQNVNYKIITAFEFEEIGSDEWKLTKYVGFDEENIEIPAQIGEKKIVSLGDSLFANNNNIKRVKLASGIKTIEHKVFNLCKSLEQIILPDTLETIGEYAFRGTAITEMIFPSSVVKLGKGVCYGCTIHKILEKNTGLVKVVLPEGLTEIPDDAFNMCEALESINIPKSIKCIGKRAFEYCESLNPFDFHEGIETIGERAFALTFRNRYDDGDNSIDALLIPKSVIRIEKNAFEDCSMEEIAFVQGCKAVLEKGAFAGTNPGSMYIPGSITKIGEIFWGTSYFSYEDTKRDEDGKIVHDAWGNDVREKKHSSVEEDQFNEEMTIYCEIGSAALSFAKSKGVKCADYESNLPQFYAHREQYKKEKEKKEAERLAEQKKQEERQKERAIAAAKFEAEYKKKEEQRLQKEQRKRLADEEYEQKKNEFSKEESLCADDIGVGLTSFVVPSHIKVIKEGAFKNNPKLKEIVFAPKSQLVRLERRSICGLRDLGKIHLPASLRDIEDEAFYATQYLSSVEFEEGCQLERIGNKAFYMIGGLGCRPITLPMGVKYIGSKAFEKSGVKKIKIPKACQIEDDSIEKNTEIIWVEPNSQQSDSLDTLTELVNIAAQKLNRFLNKFKK